MQQELKVTKSQFREPQKVELSIVRQFANMESAIVAGIGGLKHESLAEELGMNKGHFSRCLSDSAKAHFPPNKYQRLMLLCGNLAVAQHLAFVMGYDLVKRDLTPDEKKDEYIKELEAKLQGKAG